jgi:hypothetical protein
MKLESDSAANSDTTPGDSDVSSPELESLSKSSPFASDPSDKPAGDFASAAGTETKRGGSRRRRRYAYRRRSLRR